MNVARMKAPLASELMASFVARVDEINGLADGSPGFVWRLKSTSGGAALLVPYDDERILVNFSVWESVKALKDYAYRSAHAELYRRRHEWFEQFDGAYSVLWWIPAGHRPTIDEAKERLAHLQTHGPSAYAFGLKSVCQPDGIQV
jgi:hypothetical protein